MRCGSLPCIALHCAAFGSVDPAEPPLSKRLDLICRLRSPASGKSPSLARLSPIARWSWCAVIPNRGDLLRYGCIRMGRASWNPLRTDEALYRETRKRAASLEAARRDLSVTASDVRCRPDAVGCCLGDARSYIAGGYAAPCIRGCWPDRRGLAGRSAAPIGVLVAPSWFCLMLHLVAGAVRVFCGALAF